VLDKVSWPLVALVGLILGSVTALAIAGVDSTAITNVLMLLGLGGGLGVLTGVRNNVNGNLREMLTVIKSAMDKLAQSHPALSDENTTSMFEEKKEE